MLAAKFMTQRNNRKIHPLQKPEPISGVSKKTTIYTS
jgi:hypothetical protein